MVSVFIFIIKDIFLSAFSADSYPPQPDQHDIITDFQLQGEFKNHQHLQRFDAELYQRKLGLL